MARVWWAKFVVARMDDLVHLWVATLGQAQKRVPFSQLPPEDLVKFQCQVMGESLEAEEQD